MAEEIFAFQFTFACEKVTIQSANDDEDAALATPPPTDDPKQLELSPLAQEIQNRAREQAQHRRSDKEIAEDNHTLHHLEVKTINNSPRAKQKDRDSLECLILHTARLEHYHRSLLTPARTSFWPPRQPKPRVIVLPKARHFKGMKGTPMSFEPPFSTPSRKSYASYHASDNEFNLFLAQNRLLSSAAGYYKASTPANNKFASLLRRSKSATDVPPTMAEEADSVLNLLAMVEKKDREDDLLAEAMESPIPSPTSSIKHLPTTRLLGSSENLSAMSMGIADLNDEEETRLVSPPKFDDIDGYHHGGIEWESESEDGSDGEEDNGDEGLATPDSDDGDSDGYQSSSDAEWQFVY